jgi:hypothetical protein
MRSFLIKVSCFSSIIILLFGSLELIVTQGLKKSTDSNFVDWNHLFEGKINADIIINGSSKALVQVSTIIIDSLLNVNSYNLGINGHDFYLQNSKYSAYSEYNTPPKLIVQVIGNGTLKKREDLYQLEQFLPYIDNPTINKVTQDYIGLTTFDYYLPFVRYFGNKKTIKEGFLSFFNASTTNNKVSKYKGYRPNELDWDGSFERFIKYSPNGRTIALTDSSIQLFKQFISQQKKKEIPIVLVYPPTYRKSQQYTNNRAEIMALYNSIAQKYNVPLLDYSQEPLTKEKSYFYNSQHLNKKGAEIFSRKLAADLKQYLPSS